MFLIFVAGSSDRMQVFLGLDYVAQIWFYRVAVWVVPVVLFFVVRAWCRALQHAERVEATQDAAEAEVAQERQALAEGRAQPPTAVADPR